MATIGNDTLAGYVRANGSSDGNRVAQVAFENVSSFVYADAMLVETPFGAIKVPVVFGGAFHALSPAPEGMIGVSANARPLIEFGMAVQHAVERQGDVVHPLDCGGSTARSSRASRLVLPMDET